jgi:hypothetical protein
MPDYDKRREVREIGFDELVLASAGTIRESRPSKSITNSDASGSMLRTMPAGSSAGRGGWKDRAVANRTERPGLDLGISAVCRGGALLAKSRRRMFTRG